MNLIAQDGIVWRLADPDAHRAMVSFAAIEKPAVANLGPGGLLLAGPDGRLADLQAAGCQVGELAFGDHVVLASDAQLEPVGPQVPERAALKL